METGQQRARVEASAAAPPAAGVDDRLERLRRLLVAAERSEIEEIRRRQSDPSRRTRDVSEVLPDAVRSSTADSDDLDQALSPLVERGLREAVRRDPAGFAEALFPVLGPAVRKAVAQAVRGLVESLNRVIEHSFTWRGLGWRVEAWRTGTPLAEIALRHSLVFRVERVFLVERESGRLLHSVGPEEATRDRDLMSAMLTALGDFARDSFGDESAGGLDQFEMGELQVWIENGPRAMLAAVVRGEPPRDLRETMSRALETIHARLGDAIKTFNGDASTFKSARPYLEPCLRRQFARDPERPSASLVVAGALVGVALLAWGYFLYDQRSRWNAFVESVAASPGLVLAQVDPRSAVVLRDPDAADPAGLLRAAGLSLGDVRLDTRGYLSFDAEMVLKRYQRRLDPPPSTTASHADGALTVRGEADARWIARLRDEAASIPGVTRLISADLRADRGAAERLASEIESLSILFSPGAARPAADQEAIVDRLADLLDELARESSAAALSVRVELEGGTDPSGPDSLNARLGRLRAEAVRSMLASRGVEAALMTPTTRTAPPPGWSREAQRGVRPRVILE